jgi:hypothetical protein
MLRGFLEISTMRTALSLSAAAFVMLVSAEASASFHLMKVVEVFAGSAAAPNASYVQLQMYAAGQSFVGGHILHVYDAAGVEIAASTVTLSGNVANGADQANILIGTSSVAAAFGVTPDFTLPQNLSQAGGAVCFDAIDCFSWGSFAGAAADTSVSPFAALTVNKAARRSIALGLSPTLLEAADDSNNNTTDFTAVDPAPKNNAFGVPDAGTPPADAGTDSSTPPDAGKDSGISTQPSGNNPTVPPDSGASTDPGTTSSGSDSGCSLAVQPSGGWSTVLGLFAAAALLVTSRRRRNKR